MLAHCVKNDLLCVCVCTSADVIEGKSAMLLGMSQWNSNDLAEQMDTLGHLKDQPQGKHNDDLHRFRRHRFDHQFTHLNVLIF